ncbi:MAG: hypothetical protein S0880_24765 [Actinomycetota bacterium]|nr:hypothetical protein [Actinomycetota bacterium]
MPELTERRRTGHYVWFIHPWQLALLGMVVLWLFIRLIGTAGAESEDIETINPGERVEESCRVAVMNGGPCDTENE